MSKLRATVIAVLLIAVGLFVYSPVAFAGHGASTAIPWHSDVMTINQTGSLGLNGTLFVPAWVKTDCDTVPINGFAISGPSDAGCHAFAQEVLDQWLAGGWWDPRGGTEFIPPSGDHHRSGWRTIMQAHFSAGAWLSGFGQLASTFPFYPQVGIAGPGESPVGVFELCADADGAGPGAVNGATQFPGASFDADANPIDGDPGTLGAPANAIEECRQRARAAGTALMALVDHHGEPLTPGRFPRYIPHERQAWVNTLVTKYTASPTNNVDTDGDDISDDTGARVSQVFRSQHNFVTSGSPVTWFSMSNESAEGCGASGWCQWLWDPATFTLWKLEGANNPGAPITTLTVLAFTTAGATEVTEIEVIDDYNDVVVTKGLNAIEKAPSEIYQSIGQWVELGAFPGTGDQGENQAFWQDFWVLSGPNFQSEEGVNPYTWVLCGADLSSPAEEDCTVAGGAIDAPNGATMAITQFGLDPINRYGADLRPNDSSDQGAVDEDGDGDTTDNDGSCAADPAGCDEGLRTAIVQCTAGGDVDGDPLTSDCESDEGTTAGYGNDSSEVIYFREAVENKQRGFVRENRSFAFSFATGSMANGGSLSGTLRQAVAQNINETGFLMSCLNCEPLPEHFVRNHAVPNYIFSWDLTGGVGFVEHADIITGATQSIP